MTFYDNWCYTTNASEFNSYWTLNISVSAHCDIISRGNLWEEKIHACMHIVSRKDKGCVVLPFASVCSKPRLRCSQSRPCFSMGRSLSSDRTSTILSGKWECTGGRRVPWGPGGSVVKPLLDRTHPLPSAQHKQQCWALTAPLHTHPSSNPFFICLRSVQTLSAKVPFLSSYDTNVIYSLFLPQVSTDCRWPCLDPPSPSNFSWQVGFQRFTEMRSSCLEKLEKSSRTIHLMLWSVTGVQCLRFGLRRPRDHLWLTHITATKRRILRSLSEAFVKMNNGLWGLWQMSRQESYFRRWHHSPDHVSFSCRWNESVEFCPDGPPRIPCAYDYF